MCQGKIFLKEVQTINKKHEVGGSKPYKLNSLSSLKEFSYLTEEKSSRNNEN